MGNFLTLSIYLNRLRDQGILISADGPDENILKIKPPLVVTKEDVDHFIEVLIQSLKHIGN